MSLRKPRPIKKRHDSLLGAVVLLFAALLVSCSVNPKTMPVTAIPLIAGQKQQIFINEISYDQDLDRVLVPGGDTGKLFLINPNTRQVETLDVGMQADSSGGVVSVVNGQVSGRNYLFVADRSGPALHVMDPKPGNNQVLASLPLQGKPEYIRFIPNARTGENEIWITEPEQQQIEIAVFKDENPPTLVPLKDLITQQPAAPLPVPGGPTGLIYDAINDHVYTNQPGIGLTSAFHGSSHQRLPNKSWGNGCTNARGMALSEESRYLFVACEEGKLVVIDLSTGVQVMNTIFGKELNQVSYSAQTGRIYLPSGLSEIMGVFEIAAPTPEPTPTQSFFDSFMSARATPTPVPALTRLRAGGAVSSNDDFVLDLFSSADTAPNANCVTTDGRGNVWVCDPENGQILVVEGSSEE